MVDFSSIPRGMVGYGRFFVETCYLHLGTFFYVFKVVSYHFLMLDALTFLLLPFFSFLLINIYVLLSLASVMYLFAYCSRLF